MAASPYLVPGELWNDPRFHVLPWSAKTTLFCLYGVANDGFFDDPTKNMSDLSFVLRRDGKGFKLFQLDMSRLMEEGFTDERGRPKDCQPKKSEALTSTERVREFRRRKRCGNVSETFHATECNVAETLHETRARRLEEEAASSSSPLSPLPALQDEDDAFRRFWDSYPSNRRRRMGKVRAAFHEAATAGRLPPIDVLLAALARQAASPEWTEEAGRFVPMPDRWILEERWADELPGESREKKEAAPPMMRAASLDDIEELDE